MHIDIEYAENNFDLGDDEERILMVDDQTYPRRRRINIQMEIESLRKLNMLHHANHDGKTDVLLIHYRQIHPG